MPITLANGTLRIDSFSGSNYAGGKTSFEAFSADGTRVVLGRDTISHIVMLLIHENKIKSIEALKAYVAREGQ